MSSPPPVELFKGTNWEECHKFVLAIRTRALWEGKQRDSAWTADFAATYFWHKALPWHSRLPEDVRQDWSKLELALFDRWYLPEDDDEPQLEPTPAPAPAPAPALAPSRSDKASPLLQGALKLVVHGSDTNYYVEFSGREACRLTSDANEAIRVRCNSLSSSTLLESMNHSRHFWLAAHWASSTFMIGDGSNDCAHLAFVDSDTLKSSCSGDALFQLLRCTVLSNGEVIPVWKKDDASQIPLFPFVRNLRSLYLATNPEAYAGKWSTERRAKLFIEPAD